VCVRACVRACVCVCVLIESMLSAITVTACMVKFHPCAEKADCMSSPPYMR
jgi:hypothetical protein